MGPSAPVNLIFAALLAAAAVGSGGCDGVGKSSRSSGSSGSYGAGPAGESGVLPGAGGGLARRVLSAEECDRQRQDGAHRGNLASAMDSCE